MDQTFLLHSRRGSKQTIFLDFNGVNVPVDSWSTRASNGMYMQPGSYAGFSFDASAGFSDVEKNFVQQVWRRVAELFSPFDVDVTTEDGGSGAYTRTSAEDDAYGVQIAFSSGSSAASQACSGCSGVAQIGSFNVVESSPGSENPAWVFTDYTYADPTDVNSSVLTAVGAAHEAGHTLGLTHDGTATSEYYDGHANWFPIMGMSTGTAIGQWSKGEYAGANNTEDDLAVMAANGAPFRVDDYGTAPQPTPLGTRTSYAVRGVIGSDADNDYFTFDRGCAGPMMVKATGIGAGATVDLKLTVYNSAGTVIATNNPGSGQTQVGGDRWWRATGMDAAVSFSQFAKGPYSVRVEGVGHGNPLDTGYSGYASVGQYTLTISSCSTPLPGVTRPGAPIIGTARSGYAGTPVNALARWSAPRTNGGAPIRRYRLQAVRVSSSGAVIRTYTFTSISPSTRAITVRLPGGRYKFRVAATNMVGTGRYSAYSRTVIAR